ncbi:MAG: crossover junction endodeoxyribonuclease RuvC [Sphaerochaetaceae bacterium]|jgi:crossover junction endodeoxyribonuclease RuvC
MVVLGIDPGLAQTGWGVVETEGQRYRPVSYGVVKTNTKMSTEKRIHTIASEIGVIAQKHSVGVASIEDIFFAKNISSAMSVAKVIGAIIQQLSIQQLPVHLFTPLQIKLSVTGFGAAEKQQVQQMVKLLLKLDTIPAPDHAADSLAAAICYANSSLHLLRR